MLLTKLFTNFFPKLNFNTQFSLDINTILISLNHQKTRWFSEIAMKSKDVLMFLWVLKGNNSQKCNKCFGYQLYV